MRKFDIKTVLKLAKIAVEKYSENNSFSGFVIDQDGQKLKVKFPELIEALEELSEKDLAIVRRCRDCENFSKAPNAKEGHCFPKGSDFQRAARDFCSRHYIVRSPERRSVDEALNRLTQKE